MLVLQAAFTLLALALRPYISAVLNCIEIACGCLDVAYLALTMAAYLHSWGQVLDKAARGQDFHLAVGAWSWGGAAVPVCVCIWCGVRCAWPA